MFDEDSSLHTVFYCPLLCTTHCLIAVSKSYPEVGDSCLGIYPDDGVVMLDVISDEGLPVQRRVLVGQELLDRTVHPRRGRVEMRAEKARDRDPRRSILGHHSMLHAPEPVIGNQLHIFF